MLWDNHWLAMPGEVTEWWNFQSMMASNTIGYIRYVVKRNVLKQSLFEAYSFRAHTFPYHLSVKVWTWIAKMVVWCSEPKGAQRGACSQHQKQDKNMNFTAGVCCTLCCSMQNRCHSCLPSVQDNVTLRTNCNCLTPECTVKTPECNEMALYIFIYVISLIYVNIRICLKNCQPFKNGRYTKGHNRSSKYNQCIITKKQK